MKDLKQKADKIIEQGPEAVNFVRGYIDAQSASGERDKRFKGDAEYFRGYLIGSLHSETATN